MMPSKLHERLLINMLKTIENLFSSEYFAILTGIFLVGITIIAIVYVTHYSEAEISIKAIEAGYVQKPVIDNLGRVTIIWTKDEQKAEKQ